MDSYQLPHLAAHIHAGLYTGVSNAAALKKRLINAASAEGVEGEREREAVNFAFIDARLITSPALLKAAVYNAVLADVQGRLLTKTVHSEILWTLNPTNNISEAIRRYGVSESTNALILVRVASPDVSPADVERAMDDAVQGTRVPFTELGTLTDWAAVKKYHKLANETALREVKGDPEKERAVIDRIVVSSAAMKSVQA
ncbi:kinase binding protein CGI-121-domain-containing protein [Mycena amicta]|nr:kinase binding protein CGI-121-domain-containing protein [Mycena amicta]